MRRTVLSALLVTSFSLAAHAQAVPGAAQSVPQPSREKVTPALSPFESAKVLAATGHLDEALTQLDQMASHVPEPAGVERLRGTIFYQKEEFSKAVAAFSNAAAQDPDDHESIEMQGVSLFRLGRSKEAVPLLEKARTAVDQSNIDPQYVLGLCYADTGRFDDARHAFAVQYGFVPDSAEAYVLAGRLFLRRQYLAEAAAQAHKALEINPALPMAHQLLGEVALNNNNFTEAISELEAEHKLDPLNGGMYERLGDAYLRNGQFAEAQQTLDRAVLLEPTTTAPYILLGETYLKLKEPTLALQYLVHADKMDPSNYKTHFLLGRAYKETGQASESSREFKICLTLQQNQALPAPAK